MEIRIQMTNGSKIRIKRAIRKTENKDRVDIEYINGHGEKTKMGLDKQEIAFMESVTKGEQDEEIFSNS